MIPAILVIAMIVAFVLLCIFDLMSASGCTGTVNKTPAVNTVYYIEDRQVTAAEFYAWDGVSF